MPDKVTLKDVLGKSEIMFWMGIIAVIVSVILSSNTILVRIALLEQKLETLDPMIALVWGTAVDQYFGTETAAEDWGDSGDVDIAQVQLCAGSVALPFQPKSYEVELDDCQRYFETSYNTGVTPGTASAAGFIRIVGFTTTLGQKYLMTTFKTKKRTTPTIAYYDYAGTVSRVSAIDNSGGRTDGVAAGTDGIFETNFGVYITSTASGMLYSYTASAEL